MACQLQKRLLRDEADSGWLTGEPLAGWNSADLVLYRAEDSLPQRAWQYGLWFILCFRALPKPNDSTLLTLLGNGTSLSCIETLVAAETTATLRA